MCFKKLQKTWQSYESPLAYATVYTVSTFPKRTKTWQLGLFHDTPALFNGQNRRNFASITSQSTLLQKG